MYAANRDVTIGQASAANFLEQIENHFTLAECVKEGAKCAEIQAISAHAHQVAGDAVHLGDDNANDLRFLGNLHAAQLFHGHGIAEVHVHPGQVIHAVGVGNELDGRHVFADLLGTAVQIPQVRRDFGNDFAVRAQHEPQHAMRARMLRPHVDEHLVSADVELDNFKDGWIVNLLDHPSRLWKNPESSGGPF